MSTGLVDWKKQLTPTLLEQAVASGEMASCIRSAQASYHGWDTFKYHTPPAGFSIEQAWAYLKFVRSSHRTDTPVLAVNGETFWYSLTSGMHQSLSAIDAQMGSIAHFPASYTDHKKQAEIRLSSIREEAIASSQMEGANTSRKVAKDILLKNSRPHNTSEQMIVNNYQVMQKLMSLKDADLDLRMLLDIQKELTEKTLADEQDSGALRAGDDIHVVNGITGEIVHSPPQREVLEQELQKLFKYANADPDGGGAAHPIITASILHFWLAYLHPFADGNGRTARAVYYWYLLRHGYWLFQFLAVSRVIKKTKRQYEATFVYSETDENDLTYFLHYALKVIGRSIDDLAAYQKKKSEQGDTLRDLQKHLNTLNERQIQLLKYFSTHAEAVVDIATHRTRHQVVYQTARTDLLELAELGYLTVVRNKRKFEFVPVLGRIRVLFRSDHG